MTETRITLLDTTLSRAGAAIDYGFDANYTFAIVQALEEAGIEAIEIGHGLGLGTERSGTAPAAESDARYMAAARMAARKARIGVNARVGTATEDDIEAARAAGMDFVRISVDAALIDEAETLVAAARKADLAVFLTLTRAPSLPVKELRFKAPRIESWGVETVILSDCAGGMIPAQVRNHIRALTDKTVLTVGFAGRDNLQLAAGNAFAAIEAGATLIEGALKGMGQGAGTIQLEHFAAALNHAGFVTKADPHEIAFVADKFITQNEYALGRTTAELIEAQSLQLPGASDRIIQAAREFGLDTAALAAKAARIGGGLELDLNALRAVAQIMVWAREDGVSEERGAEVH